MAFKNRQKIDDRVIISIWMTPIRKPKLNSDSAQKITLGQFLKITASHKETKRIAKENRQAAGKLPAGCRQVAGKLPRLKRLRRFYGMYIPIINLKHKKSSNNIQNPSVNFLMNLAIIYKVSTRRNERAATCRQPAGNLPALCRQGCGFLLRKSRLYRHLACF